MNIQNNIMALNAQRQTALNTLTLKSSLQKLASGNRINSAADDAAGLAISESMRAQITGTERAMMNAQDGVSFVQTAEGALTEVHSMLNRLTDLSMQASNGILSGEQRASLQNEADSIMAEIDRIAGSTNFNGTKILDGSMADGAQTLSQPAVSGVNVAGGEIAMNDLKVYDGNSGSMQTIEVDGQKFALTDAANYSAAQAAFGSDVNLVTVDGSTGNLSGADMQAVSAAVNTATGNAFEAGANGIAVRSAQGSPLQFQIGEGVGETATVSVNNMSSQALGIGNIDLSTAQGASAALTSIRNAINTVSTTRGDLGATQNRLEHTISNLGVKNENIQAAESRIRDADMAKSILEFTKRNVLQQSGMAMQSHSMMQSQQVLQFLR